MRKDWLYWGGGSTTTGSRKRGRRGGEDSEAAPSGCMCSVFQLFDFHHFQYPLNHQSSLRPNFFITEEPKNLKGIEAPRNSLELEGPFMKAGSLSSTHGQEENLNIPVGFRIKTSDQTKSKRACVSECSVSLGIKTPNLVARLMGLDLLPERSRPSYALSSNHSTSNPMLNSQLIHPQVQNLKQQRGPSRSRIRSVLDNEIIGSHSLPETPRISSGRRSDVDCHRLSLQINKENIAGLSQELEFSSYLRKRRGLRHEDENRSPERHARQFVKESVSRKVGFDMTNTVRNRGQGRKDDPNVLIIKSKKPSMEFTRASDESSNLSCSPTLKLLESKNKPVMTSLGNKNQTSQSSKLSSSPLSSSNGTQASCPKLEEQKVHHQQKNSVQKIKKTASDRGYSNSQVKTVTSLASGAIRNKQEQPYIRSSTTNKANHLDKRNKKIPLSNKLLSANLPSRLLVKKNPSPPATKLSHLQAEKQSKVSEEALPSKKNLRIPSCSTHSSYKQEESTQKSTVQGIISINDERCNDATNVGYDRTELQYISRILRLGGNVIERDRPVSFANWYSQSRALHPSIFHYIENFDCSTFKDSKLGHRSNRKLMFNVVDELLVDIQRPNYMNLRPRVKFQIHGSELIDMVRSFSSTNCRVLEDIIELVDKDLCTTHFVRWVSYEEEGEGVVKEIGSKILDDLLHETAMVVAVVYMENW